MTPAVRRLLREHGLTAAMIVGTGGGSRITRDDVSNYVETQRTKTSVGGQIVGGAGGRASGAEPHPRPADRASGHGQRRGRPHAAAARHAAPAPSRSASRTAPTKSSCR